MINTEKLVQITTKYNANIVYHHFNNGSACVDDCRALFREILELCNENERREIIENLVKYDYKNEIKKMVE